MCKTQESIEILEKFVSDRNNFGGETIDDAIRVLINFTKETKDIEKELYKLQMKYPHKDKFARKLEEIRCNINGKTGDSI